MTRKKERRKGNSGILNKWKSYKRKGRDILSRSAQAFKKCPDCNSSRIATLSETGEKFCKKCGLVLL